MKWMLDNEMPVKLLMAIYAITSVILVFQLNLSAFIVIFFMGIISFFYAWKLPGARKINLRDVPRLKIFLIAIVWAGTSVLLPTINENIPFSSETALLLIANFAFIVAITIPFDIRDVLLDEENKKTIPQVFGIKKSKIISIAWLCISVIAIMLAIDIFNYGLIVIALLSIILILKSEPTRNDMYYSFMIDGLLILQPFLIYLAQSL